MASELIQQVLETESKASEEVVQARHQVQAELEQAQREKQALLAQAQQEAKAYLARQTEQDAAQYRSYIAKVEAQAQQQAETMRQELAPKRGRAIAAVIEQLLQPETVSETN